METLVTMVHVEAVDTIETNAKEASIIVMTGKSHIDHKKFYLELNDYINLLRNV